MNLLTLPATKNGDLVKLSRPKKLDLTAFEALEVSDDELKARVGIYALEEHMHTKPDTVDDKHMDEMGMTPVHRFVNGLYMRELYIPGDRVVVGKRHAIEHIVMLTTGSCLCITERGTEHMVAPMTFISPAGEKRVVMTYDDGIGCTWVTMHPTNETDLEAIERDVIIAEPARQLHYEGLREKAKELQMNEATS
jgi:hypothetical protein